MIDWSSLGFLRVPWGSLGFLSNQVFGLCIFYFTFYYTQKAANMEKCSLLFFSKIIYLPRETRFPLPFFQANSVDYEFVSYLSILSHQIMNNRDFVVYSKLEGLLTPPEQ